jgi:hypothetical protein
VATINNWGFYLGPAYKLTPTTTFNAVYGFRTVDSSGHSGVGRTAGPFGNTALFDLAHQKSIHVNIMQQFWQRFQLGLEYERQWVDAFRNNSGSHNLYHGGLWFFF